MRIPLPAGAAALGLVLLAPPLLGDEAEDGFFLQSLPYPGLAVTATLSSGDILAFDGATVDRYTEQGNYLATLATFVPAVWPSFLVIDPSEGFVLAGESTLGGLYRVDLGGAGATLLGTLPNLYDAAFEDAGHVLVSAATCGFGCGNEIHRVDVTTGATLLLATVPGASGPVAVGTAGELYYGTVSDAFPPPPSASDVLSWSATQLTGNPVVTDADAVVIGSGYEAIGSLTIDTSDGRLYLAENDYTTGLDRVRRVTASASTAPILVEGTTGQWISNLEFFPGDGVRKFRGYQPSEGGRLLYDTTDFFQVWEREELVPLRPSVELSGPGTTGIGTVDLAVVDGPPSGWALALYGPSAFYDPNELPIYLPLQDLNVFLGLDLFTLQAYPVPMVLDLQGTGGLSFFHDGSLLGLVAIQALVLDAGGAVAAVSRVAFL